MNMDQYIGRLLDNRYEILEIIGTGGMAVVYKARCHRLNRLVAIKILKDEFALDEEFRRRFHAEGEAVAMLSHPNIVQVFDVSSTEKANFIVMELIDGISLKQYMEKKGVLNWKETLHFSMQIAKGLEHAHSRGIVHRDIKPHNVMVLKNGSVKVMDFGIARVMNKSNTLTKEALGSVHYISPEQAKGGHTDNRSDIYSLSVVMYEMMAGRPPYDGESAVAVAIQHINGGAAMPSTLNPNIPGGLEQIIMKGMSLEIKDRYVSATEMLQDMEEFRRNPAILFSYKTILDDATRSLTDVSAEALKTTADRVVQSKTGGTKTRTGADAPKTRQMAGVSSGAGQKRSTSGSVSRNTGSMNRNREEDVLRRAQHRRKVQEELRKEEERSRVATTAIVVCSAVAVVAIIIFLVAVFNGWLLNNERDTIEVPTLIGSYYTDEFEQKYKDFTIRLTDQEYHEDYLKGQIIRQEPLAGSHVDKGTELWITVSLGEEPEIKVMDDYVGFNYAQVQAALEGQGFRPMFKNEPSYIYDVGEIIRTDPAAGTELKEGQTIKIYVSTGPEKVLRNVPDVMGKDVSVAREILNAAGFDNVVIREADSNKPKGQVIYQSERKDTEVDVTKEILLEVSKGPAETNPQEQPKETTPPTTQPPETQPPETTVPPEVVTKEVSFNIPVKDAAYVLSIHLNGKEVVDSQTIEPNTGVVKVTLTGSGTVKYDLLVEGEFVSSQEVVFTDD